MEFITRADGQQGLADPDFNIIDGNLVGYGDGQATTDSSHRYFTTRWAKTGPAATRCRGGHLPPLTENPAGNNWSRLPGPQTPGTRARTTITLFCTTRASNLPRFALYSGDSQHRGIAISDLMSGEDTISALQPATVTNTAPNISFIRNQLRDYILDNILIENINENRYDFGPDFFNGATPHGAWLGHPHRSQSRFTPPPAITVAQIPSSGPPVVGVTVAGYWVKPGETFSVERSADGRVWAPVRGAIDITMPPGMFFIQDWAAPLDTPVFYRLRTLQPVVVTGQFPARTNTTGGAWFIVAAGHVFRSDPPHGVWVREVGRDPAWQAALPHPVGTVAATVTLPDMRWATVAQVQGQIASGGVAWIQDAYQPRYGFPVRIDDLKPGVGLVGADSFRTATWPQPFDEIQILGDNIPIESVGVRQRSGGIPAEIYALTPNDSTRLRNLMLEAGILLILGGPCDLLSPVEYVIIPDLAETHLGNPHEVARFTGTLRVCREPSTQIHIPFWTWAQVEAMVADHHGPITYQQLADYTGRLTHQQVRENPETLTTRNQQ
jgi:flavin-binding protein dodecin